MNNPFFKNNGPFKLCDLLKVHADYPKLLEETTKDITYINDIKNLNEANSKDITFFHSIKYKDLAIKILNIINISNIFGGFF